MNKKTVPQGDNEKALEIISCKRIGKRQAWLYGELYIGERYGFEGFRERTLDIFGNHASLDGYRALEREKICQKWKIAGNRFKIRGGNAAYLDFDK